MRRVGIGVQQRHGDRLVAVLRDALQHQRKLFGVERLQHLALEAHPLPHLEDPLAGNQRVRLQHVQVVGFVALLPAEDEHVAESARGDQRRLRAAPLDDRVGRDRRRVEKLPYAGLARSGLFEQRRQAVPDRFGRVGGRGGDLVDRNAAGLLVAEHEVGEGAANVHPDAEPALSGRIFRFIFSRLPHDTDPMHNWFRRVGASVL